MADASQWTLWPAPAKLNLLLQITGRRSDGYHLLQSVFQLLDWGDTVALRPRSDGQCRRRAGAEGVPVDDDLAVRAARLLQTASGARLGADIAILKQIPMGGGFGGGSSDAATVLLALNRLWALDWSIDALAELGLQLGADVPVFVRGRSAWAEGVGDVLQPMTLGEFWYVLLDCAVHSETAALFQSAELTRNAPGLKMADFVSSMVGRNAFAPLLRSRAPRIAAALDAIARLGIGGLTGTGGGCFLRVESRAEADAAAVTLAALGRCIIARGVDRSPLMLQLDSAPLTAAAGRVETTQNWDWWGVAKW
ncbi:4-(cytidine 5'-diphospho)-2-C-methyl-D-erythritol kinase [Pseudomarimonas arenosa]|uniref:4-diphosphocytidyl-2-C-methyl-D-erythritol kinase n=1 Tax=Pseudomarimonas arenosa TaxID=2774145 RepID=A0AAW3ZHN0_9GAMM|nr:4-(cytidine 5'-diphospho)-2-C-methyl-D-erythritol kinase [Pseudomarimonas arenosa]MBD8525526.1 4-(cytidine 5'-diphospho)-2-C-methyl-D-erythritol kinase [Pseudomarimonas arenosa]